MHIVLYILFEGGSADQQFICQDTEAPAIDFVAVVVFAQLLWRRILQTAYYCISQSVIIVDCTAEITYLHIAFIHKEVFRLQVPMDDLLVVHVFDSL